MSKLDLSDKGDLPMCVHAQTGRIYPLPATAVEHLNAWCELNNMLS